MIIPIGYAHVVHKLSGVNIPQGAAVTYGIKLDGSVGIVDRAISLYSAFQDNVVVEMSNATVHESVLVKYGPNANGSSYEQAGSGVGGVAGPAAPPNCALLMQKKGVLGGRKNRGRCYLPGLREADIEDGGVLNAQTVSDWFAGIDAWFSALELLDMPMVLLHSASSDPTTVASLAVSPLIATQRRRLR